MSETRTRSEELRRRIQDDIAFFKGSLPERNSIAWGGYLAAMLEWNLLSVAEHDSLMGLLPKVENNPVIDILLGRDEV